MKDVMINPNKLLYKLPCLWCFIIIAMDGPKTMSVEQHKLD